MKNYSWIWKSWKDKHNVEKVLNCNNQQNSKTSDPYGLLLNFSDEITLKEEINMLLYISPFTKHEKI